MQLYKISIKFVHCASKSSTKMKKFVFLFSFLLSIAFFANAQRVNNCGYIIPKKSLLKNNFQSVYEARDVVNAMLDTIKWKENFTLQEKNGINNAYATIINNKRWIIYDNDFLESIDDYAATKWASISIMAHEMGHHKLGHVFTGQGSTVPTEIEADEFSGYVMNRMGATLAQSVAAIKTISTDKASATHPGKTDRVNAITKGWNRGAAEPRTNAGTSGTKPPTNPTTPPKPTPTNTPPKPTVPADQNYIVLSMQNVQNETILLSDDGKNFQQQVMEPNKPFAFHFEIYNWGWLKLPYYNGYRVFKIEHGKDYSILWNSRKQIWTCVAVPE
jgi:hypothetical protein